MCTSVFTTTKDANHILARTMDFSYVLDVSPTYIPRNYCWKAGLEKSPMSNRYGFIGAGSHLEDSYFVADGVNEYGLSVAELYLPGEAVYQDQSYSEKINLAPHELIIWLLGNFKSVKDLEKKISEVNLVKVAVPGLNIITPLHWIITDATGKCVIIEPTKSELTIRENPVGVMTNTPNFEWHLENLRNYLTVQPKQYLPSSFGTFVATPFSQGTGTSGLPGGYTPPDRFVRAAFFKEYIKLAENEEMGVLNAYHILSSVSIPKGIVLTQENEQDYTQYIGTMCNTSKTYYFSKYDDRQIAKVQLNPKLLSQKEVIQFSTDTTSTFKDLNKFV